MDSIPSYQRLSAQPQSHSQFQPLVYDDSHFELGGASQAGSSRLKPGAQLTMMKYLQDLPDADIPVSDMTPRYHTGRVPNSKAGDGKPRLLLMGQRRYVTTFQ